jgi:hypothetical protein
VVVRLFTPSLPGLTCGWLLHVPRAPSLRPSVTTGSANQRRDAVYTRRKVKMTSTAAENSRSRKRQTHHLEEIKQLIRILPSQCSRLSAYYHAQPAQRRNEAPSPTVVIDISRPLLVIKPSPLTGITHHEILQAPLPNDDTASRTDDGVVPGRGERESRQALSVCCRGLLPAI